jgi:hypothetical protein
LTLIRESILLCCYFCLVYGPAVNYEAFVRAARKYANSGEEQRLALMTLLMETEPQTAIWWGNPHQTHRWDVLLREERLCTPTLYRAFKTAAKFLDVQKFGVYASAALARLPKDHRQDVTRKTLAWIKMHHVPPTYQLVSEYVRQRKRELGLQAPLRVSPQILKLRKENAKLKRRVEQLEAALTKMGYIK